MLSKEQVAIVKDAVSTASTTWKKAFNLGDAAGCAAQYEPTAVMNAKPFGTFKGIAAIQEFWQQLIDDGFADVEYLEPKIEVVDETSAVLTSRWEMNKAKGIIHKELWVLQEDGSAKLRDDDFEAMNE
ncbi:MAG: nuclear transport factor 2 family protein [Cyanobacteria bacterium J06642_3]